MANPFDAIRNWFLEPIINQMLGAGFAERATAISKRRAYTRGKQKAWLKTGTDNIVVNFTGLVAKRAVSWMFGRDFELVFPEETNEDGEALPQPQKDYLQSIYQANGGLRLFKRVCRYGVEAGTCYIRISPDGDGNMPRLIALDPLLMTIKNAPTDVDEVIAYIMHYQVGDSGNEQNFREITERLGEGWVVKTERAESNGRWAQAKAPVVWNYPFAPIVHWQNLTQNGSPYGSPDIDDDLMELNDKLNFNISNVSKIIRLHAHPKTWGRKFGNLEKVSWGADDMLLSDSPDAFLANLEMGSDLGSSMGFIHFLRQAFFDIARSVDIDSLGDKLGAITNFALRVLYQDALDNLEDRRSNYAAGIRELNHRLLEISTQIFSSTDGGEVVWEDVLPIDPISQTNALKADNELGIVSKETMATARGYKWGDESKRIEAENGENADLGTFILKNFTQGKGAPGAGGFGAQGGGNPGFPVAPGGNQF